MESRRVGATSSASQFWRSRPVADDREGQNNAVHPCLTARDDACERSQSGSVCEHEQREGSSEEAPSAGFEPATVGLEVPSDTCRPVTACDTFPGRTRNPLGRLARLVACRSSPPVRFVTRM